MSGVAVVEPSLGEFLRGWETAYPEDVIHLPDGTEMTFHCYFSLRKTAEVQARQALLLFGLEPNVKLGIAVDEDIDVFDQEQVLWELATRFQADQDLFIVPKVFCDRLDPSSVDGMSARMGIDATTPPRWDAQRLELPETARAAAADIARRVLSASPDIVTKREQAS